MESKSTYGFQEQEATITSGSEGITGGGKVARDRVGRMVGSGQRELEPLRR